MREELIGRTRGRVRLEIDLDVLKENYAKIRQAVDPCGVVCVLKANAYGLGVEPMAAALTEAGAEGFAAAELNEALKLVQFGRPTQILGGLLKEEIPEAVAAGIILPIGDLETAREIAEEAGRQNKTAECHCLVDTGMGRLGILQDTAVEVISKVMALPNLKCAGIYSHFPVAYRAGGEITERQVADFLKIVASCGERGITFEKIHIANSDAVNNFPFTYEPPFNVVRTGINLHGSFDAEGHRALKLKSVLSLKARLVAARTLPKGMTIGYGCSYKLIRDTRVGTVAAGYADGLPMALSNRGYLLVNGHQCPVLGRVSMDYTTVDLSNVPDAQRGDEVICLGGEGVDAISVDDWARIKGTHPYDIICSFGSRVERVYLNGD